MPKKSPVEQPWRPNFRDASLLPDIKPVRSVFFINFGTLAVALALLFYWLFLEWQIATVSTLISTDRKEITRLEKPNAVLLDESSQFERVAKLINEIQSFVGVPLKPSLFLAAIGSARPPAMTLTSFSYTIESRQEAAPAPKKDADPSAKKTPPKTYAVYAVSIGGSLSGTATQATRAVELFRDRLESLELFKELKFAVKPVLKTFERNKGLDVYTFTLVLEVRL